MRAGEAVIAALSAGPIIAGPAAAVAADVPRVTGVGVGCVGRRDVRLGVAPIERVACISTEGVLLRYPCVGVEHRVRLGEDTTSTAVAEDADCDGTLTADDCDDSEEAVYPGAPDDYYDGIISDCDDSDEFDADGDGYDAAEYGGDDCDDARSDVNIGMSEVWYDGVDQDCDGSDDDQDLDGFLNADDCDDTDPDSYPGAEGLDENCEEVEPELNVDGLGVDTGAGYIGSATGGGGTHGCSDTKGALGVGFLGLFGLGFLRRRRD